jgi:hypothetical protein
VRKPLRLHADYILNFDSRGQAAVTGAFVQEVPGAVLRVEPDERAGPVFEQVETTPFAEAKE